MRFIDRKVGLAIGAGVASLGLFGAVALAAFAPDAAPTAATLVPANAQNLAKDGKHPDKLKDLLDGLVKKGVITQPQEDAILAALKDAAGDREHERAAKHVLEGLFAASAKYLGLTEKDLHAELPGHSLGEIEAAMRGGNSLAQIAVGQGKTRQGLYDAITSAAFKRVDDAQAAGKLTADQAKAAKDRIAIEVNTFIDRKPGATTNGVRTAIGNLPTVKRPTTGTP